MFFMEKRSLKQSNRKIGSDWNNVRYYNSLFGGVDPNGGRWYELATRWFQVIDRSEEFLIPRPADFDTAISYVSNLGKRSWAQVKWTRSTRWASIDNLHPHSSLWSIHLCVFTAVWIVVGVRVATHLRSIL
jgi:hypothetical protein